MRLHAPRTRAKALDYIRARKCGLERGLKPATTFALGNVVAGFSPRLPNFKRPPSVLPSLAGLLKLFCQYRLWQHSGNHVSNGEVNTKRRVLNTMPNVWTSQHLTLSEGGDHEEAFYNAAH